MTVFLKRLILSYLVVVGLTLLFTGFYLAHQLRAEVLTHQLSLSPGEVDQRIADIRTDVAKAGAAGLLLALVAGWLSSRWISRPLQTLTTAARMIGEGPFDAPVSLRGEDEFSQLARAFSEISLRTEEKVRELTRERTLLTAILGALVESVTAVDHQGRVIFANAAAEKLFGVDGQQIRGRPFFEVFRHTPLTQAVQEALDTGAPITREIAIHSPEERILTIHALPINYGGQETGLLAAMHDLTELRRLERTRQEFVANVSHELKTPLTAIKGYVETLLNGALEDPKHNREFLQIIDDHARHLTQLIDDVLDLSAIEAKRATYRIEAVAVQDVLDRLIKGTAPMAKAKEVTVKNHLLASVQKVRADRDKLAQILLNLLDNAIKFNKTGGSVEIFAEQQDGHLRISIQDTGTGIPPEDLPRIFERFYRVDKARSHAVPGTGLGLSIVKHLVEAQQGTVHVESKAGEGSVFRFTLPLAN